jgi:hypothetical protein
MLEELSAERRVEAQDAEPAGQGDAAEPPIPVREVDD